MQAILATPTVTSAPPSPQVDATQAAASEDADWTYDPNEPRYCICNQVSYGDMVACDNEDVIRVTCTWVIFTDFVLLVPI